MIASHIDVSNDCLLNTAVERRAHVELHCLEELFLPFAQQIWNIELSMTRQDPGTVPPLNSPLASVMQLLQAWPDSTCSCNKFASNSQRSCRRDRFPTSSRWVDGCGGEEAMRQRWYRRELLHANPDTWKQEMECESVYCRLCITSLNEVVVF
ncbi:uncharacterized protein V6R79_021313 [Siganus canaliculatus]